MNIQNLANQLKIALKDFQPEIVKADTGSCYVQLIGCKVKSIRVANHTGHAVKPRTWQLRCDVMSSRKGTNRIYNDIKRLIKDLT